MADALDAMQQRIRTAKAAQAWLEQARALADSDADEIVFTCANPPYSGLFSASLPRTLWGPALEAAILEQQALVDEVTNALP